MATKDNSPGLLSKVAKFVRNPTTNWTDLDKQDPEPDQGYSKQALKEMIERKRQNDFVRKREFDQLRKLRSREPAANPDLAGRPSYFQSSLPANPGERAMTIKKIDEIEAQMSNQWWQGKGAANKNSSATAAEADTSDTPATPSTPDVERSPPPVAGDPAYAATRLATISEISYAATNLAPMAAELPPPEQPDFAATQTSSTFGYTVEAAQAALRGSDNSFVNSRPFAVELVEVVTDPELEEAAIRFANGDHLGAESSLQDALANPELRREQSDSWTAALFDLYRATGQQQRFDQVAIEYAERSGRSAPAWFSMPERLGVRSARSDARTVASRLHEDPLWTSPADFATGTVDELQLAIANAGQPWFLDWSPLTRIMPEAVDALGAVFSGWCTTAIALRFRGADALERALRLNTVSGTRDAGQAPWRLRMDAMRVMGLQDDFELVALDYCVTFEVSPPAWLEPRCTMERDTPATGESNSVVSELAEISASVTVNSATAQAMTIPMGLETTPATIVELAGEIVGEATEALERLELARQGNSRLVISCANLVRVDFSAAGSILNWVAARQNEGCHLQFRDVHRLVAVFFHVIGINEHARVVLRTS